MTCERPGVGVPRRTRNRTSQLTPFPRPTALQRLPSPRHLWLAPGDSERGRGRERVAASDWRNQRPHTTSTSLRCCKPWPIRSGCIPVDRLNHQTAGAERNRRPPERTQSRVDRIRVDEARANRLVRQVLRRQGRLSYPVRPGDDQYLAMRDHMLYPSALREGGAIPLNHFAALLWVRTGHRADLERSRPASESRYSSINAFSPGHSSFAS